MSDKMEANKEKKEKKREDALTDLGPLPLDLGDDVPTSGRIDRSKKPLVLDSKILELRESFLANVTSDTPYKSSRGDLNICVLEPGQHFASITWCPSFLESKHSIELKKGLTNNLESLLMYENNLHVPSNIVMAVLECIRKHLKPTAIHMIDANILTPNKCKIVFKFTQLSSGTSK